ncbi:MAG: biotin--[acetyl-CoA-carboxylase] ligase [Limnochordia bacterium]|jgi:BirA family biotin operon repressor/biotin-[acetyl-CoA-carboxylase] ligase
MKRKIIRFLKTRPGEFVSGEEIGIALGVSRTAICKHMRQLAQMGYQIEAYPHRGYRLVAPSPHLLPWEVEDGLEARLLGSSIHHRMEIDSTNTWAKEEARDGAPEGSLFLAEMQLQGRGRRGRRWLSPQGGLYFSLVLRPPISPRQAPQLTLMAAVGLQQGLMDLGVYANLKWPNDLLVQGRKLAGILVEMGAEMDRINYAVLGVGINVAQGPLMTAIGLEEIQPGLDRRRCLQRLLLGLEETYLLYLEQGFGPIREKYLEAWAHDGDVVNIYTDQGAFQATTVDIAADGGLVVQGPDGGFQTLYGGDVSLRMERGIENNNDG